MRGTLPVAPAYNHDRIPEQLVYSVTKQRFILSRHQVRFHSVDVSNTTTISAVTTSPRTGHGAGVQVLPLRAA